MGELQHGVLLQRTDHLKYLQESTREEQYCPLVQVRWEQQLAIHDTKATTAHYSWNSNNRLQTWSVGMQKTPKGTVEESA